MMKKNTAVIAFFCCLFFSCNQKHETDRKVAQKNTTETIPSGIDADFSVFLEKFSQDSIFQISRVKFPLKTKEWMDPETGMVEKEIKRSEYLTLDFICPKDVLTREYDRYTQKIRTKGSKCVVMVRGIDNGIFSDFFFEKIKGKWNLVAWEEKST